MGRAGSVQTHHFMFTLKTKFCGATKKGEEVRNRKSKRRKSDGAHKASPLQQASAKLLKHVGGEARALKIHLSSLVGVPFAHGARRRPPRPPYELGGSASRRLGHAVSRHTYRMCSQAPTCFCRRRS